jgi:predicted nucleic acid-binding protein
MRIFKSGGTLGEIRTNLEKQDNSIGENDLPIAGHVQSEGLILVANNLGEFEQWQGCSVWRIGSECFL